MKKIYHIAIVAPTPFYYHVPLYRTLEESPEIDLTVYYCSDETLRGVELKKAYGVDGKFAPRKYLLEGYKSQFLKNYSPLPSYMSWPFGLMNFGVCTEIIRGKYDMVILQAWTNLTWWLVFAVCVLYRVPVVFMTDENILARESKPWWKKILKKVIVGNIVFRFADGFLTAGSANENLYSYFGVPAKKMVRMYFSWGYESLLQQGEALKSQRNTIRKSLHIDEADFVILFMGRLASEKDPFSIVKAYQAIQCPNKKLIFTGDGPLRADLEKYIQEANIQGISLAGFQGRDTIPNFYAIADVLVLPSTYEPWGIVVNEAMCFGLPVIASDKVGAAVDLVKNGYNGFIFPAKDAEQLSQALEKIIQLTPKERQLFGERSLVMIHAWLQSMDPARQIIAMVEKINRKNTV